jgi:dethiobiotin synthetase
VVVGTATEVGKTWVTACVLSELRDRGHAVSARKPAQSFSPEERGHTDAEVLAGATGESPTAVTAAHRWYPVPMAPPMAAAALGQPVPTMADYLAELRWPDGTDYGFVETAGGVRSPLAEDGDAVALIETLAPDVVLLVADAGLGTINAVRLSAAALGNDRLLVCLNRFDAKDPLHQANRAWLADRDGFVVVADPVAVADWLDQRGG